MKTADNQKDVPIADDIKAKAAKKQRRQLIVLGMLVMVLGVVLSGQLGDDAPAVAVPSGGIARAATDESSETVDEAVETVPVEANPVLSRPLADAGADEVTEEGADDTDELGSDPFSAFWSTTAEVQDTEVQLQPPVITLSATLESDRLPVAVIDGRMAFLGDDIQGWTLDEIRERAVVLRAPSNDIYTVEMPVLYGRIDAPPVVGDVLPDHVLDADSSTTDAGAGDALIADPFTFSSGPVAEADSQ